MPLLGEDFKTNTIAKLEWKWERLNKSFSFRLTRFHLFAACMRMSVVTSKHTAAIHFLSISLVFPCRFVAEIWFSPYRATFQTESSGSALSWIRYKPHFRCVVHAMNGWWFFFSSSLHCKCPRFVCTVEQDQRTCRDKKNERTCLLWNLVDSSKFPCLCFLFVFILQLFACFYNTHCTNQKNTRYFCVYIYLVPLSHGMYFLFWSLFSVRFYSRWRYTNAMLLKSYFRCC